MTTVPEADVRQMIRLLGEVARGRGSIEGKKRLLMDGLCRLIDADAWSWIVSRAAEDNDNPAIAAFLYGGLTNVEVGRYAQLMQDRNNTPIEYSALNALRQTHDRFTRSWDQLVTPEEWYGPKNRPIIDQLGFEHVLYAVKILDGDGLFSGISMKRRIGRPNFTDRERRIAHIVTGEVDWLHYDKNLDVVTREVRPLSPRLRTVLTLLVDGKSVKEVASQLNLSSHYISDCTKRLYRHFGVNSRPELLRHFMSGDGGDEVDADKEPTIRTVEKSAVDGLLPGAPTS